MRFAEKVFFSYSPSLKCSGKAKTASMLSMTNHQALAVSFFVGHITIKMVFIFHVATALQKVASSFYDYFTIFVKVNPYYSRRRTTNININKTTTTKKIIYLLSPSF